MRRRLLAKGGLFWRQTAEALPLSSLIAMYEAGYAGAERWPDEEEAFAEMAARANGYASGGDIATAMGWAGSSAGKLGLAWCYAIDAFDAMIWPGSAQERGDCVSHGARNAAVLTLGIEIFLALVDEITRRVEGRPDIALASAQDGVLSTEAVYWWRDHGGDGWSCGHAAQVISSESGMWLRKNYPEFGVDLSTYSGKTAGKWGRTSPPEAMKAFGREHLIRKATPLSGWEPACDFLDQGYGIAHCGGQAWSNKRDANGFSETRPGGWSHSESYIGFDRRPWVQERYGCAALLLQLNSWGIWNTGPRDVYDSARLVPLAKKQRWIVLGLVNSATGNILIPEGSRWVRCDTAARRDMYAYSSASGWPARRLSDAGFDSNILG